MVPQSRHDGVDYMKTRSWIMRMEEVKIQWRTPLAQVEDKQANQRSNIYPSPFLVFSLYSHLFGYK